MIDFRFHIRLQTTWDRLSLRTGSRVSLQEGLLRELGEREENATQPGVTQICIQIWDNECAQDLYDSLCSHGNYDLPDAWEDDESEGYDSIETMLRSKDGSPITLGQLLAAFCTSLRKLNKVLDECFGKYTLATFKGWHMSRFERGCLYLDDPVWSF